MKKLAQCKASVSDLEELKKQKECLMNQIKEEEDLAKELECKISQHEKLLTRHRVSLRNLEKEGIQKAKLKC